ncbi:unnamed protein product [Thelazia callipaeda]|uniref:Apple domain-containing protein n=1 Tax=Thelazia callipaeda TaxID=103827 RepID=A0A0N5CU50_THECL|nr:unnamed protein product [Thelazia callipaeda]
MVFPLLNHSIGKSQYIRCFQRILRRSIDNSQPIIELFYVTPHHCIDHCIFVSNNNPSRAKLCHSFVYDYLQYSCRLYDHDGKQPPAILHPANGFDYFKRISTVNQCSGPESPFNIMNFQPDSPLNVNYSLKISSTGTDSNDEAQALQISTRDLNNIFETDQNSLTSSFTTTPISNFIVRQSENFMNGDSQMMNTHIKRTVEQQKLLQQNFFPAFGFRSQQFDSSNSYQKTDPGKNPFMWCYLNNNYLPSQQQQPLDTSSGLQKNHPKITGSQNEENIDDKTNYDSKENSNSEEAHSKTSKWYNELMNIMEKEQKVSSKASEKNDIKTTENDFSNHNNLPKPPKLNLLPIPEMTFQSTANNEKAKNSSTISNTNSMKNLQLLKPGSLSYPEIDLQNKSSVGVHNDEQHMTTIDDFPKPPTLLPLLNYQITTMDNRPLIDMTNTEKNMCKTAYYIVIGYEIVLPISSDENDGPKNEKLNCSSLNYFPSLKKCEIYNTLAEPHGSGSLIENDDCIYAEKFCLRATYSACQEDEIFILYAQKKVNAEAMYSKKARSITGCLYHCLDTKNCKCAVFDSNKHQCHLFDLNISNSLESVIPAGTGWILIENSCESVRRKPVQKNNIASEEMINLNDMQWTEWSLCQFKHRGRAVRVRTKNCSRYCPDNHSMQAELC